MQSDGYNQMLGTEFVEVTPDRVVLRCVIKPDLHQPYGIVHGGVYCSLVETAASVAAAMWFGDRGNVVGVANHTNFIRATREGALSVTASPVQRGRRQQLWQVDITECLFDLDGVLTRTATVHAAAWKAMFDEFLRSYAEKTGTDFRPFDDHA